MSTGFTEKYNVVVVGAGHAGCEAAMGAARMGLRTALYTNQHNNVAELERILTFYKQLQGGGDVSPLQTDQVESQLLRRGRALARRARR